eukprot:g363.t1
METKWVRQKQEEEEEGGGGGGGGEVIGDSNTSSRETTSHGGARRGHQKNISCSEISLASSQLVFSEPNYKVYIAIAVSMISACMFGMNQAVFGIVHGFHDFQKYWCEPTYSNPQNGSSSGFFDGANDVTADRCYGVAAATNEMWQHRFVLWAAAYVTFGSAIGGLVVGPISANRCGRRFTIVLGALICIFGTVLTISAPTGDYVDFFMVGRFVVGVASGTSIYVGPLILTEIGPPSFRNLSGFCFQFHVVLGSALGVYVASALNQYWRTCLALPAAPALVIVLLSWGLPESPVYRIRNAKGPETIAILEEALADIRVGDVDAEAAVLYRWFRENSPTERTSWKSLFRGDLLRLTSVAVGLQICQQLTCINVFLNYTVSIFQVLRFDNPQAYACLWNSVMLLTMVYVIVRITMHDKDYTGRRGRLLGRASVMGPALMIAGLASSFRIHAMANVMLAFYGLAYQTVWGPSFRDDIWGMFSGNEREKVMALAIFAQHLSNGIIIVGTPHLYTWNGEWTMFILGAVNLVTFLMTYELMRRTRPHLTNRSDVALGRQIRATSRSPSKHRHRKSDSSTGFGFYLPLSPDGNGGEGGSGTGGGAEA